jgi:NADH dehydrogenase [ubiquinone] 1 alpha subcomplex assembly factor 7
MMLKRIAFSDSSYLRKEFSVCSLCQTVYNAYLGKKENLSGISRPALSKNILQLRFIHTGKKNDREWVTFQVDRSNLINHHLATPAPPKAASNLPKVPKEELSPLAKDLISYIQLRGPISMHDYMSQTSNHLLHGYYQSFHTEKIGNRGDFVTAPELSQLFGEMIGIWCLMKWQEMKKPAQLMLIELGPGKGSLMADILRVASNFPEFQKALSIHFVELSQALRAKQKETLESLTSSFQQSINSHINTDLVKKDNEQVDDSNSSNSQKQQGIVDLQPYEIHVPRVLKGDSSKRYEVQKLQVSWYSFLSQIPYMQGTDTQPTNCLIVGQEFLDAFPVHQFVYTDRGWRERLVDVDSSEQSSLHFRFVLSPNETPAIKSLLKSAALIPQKPSILFSSPPSRKGSQQSATSSTASESGTTAGMNAPAVGEGIEISPLALATMEDISRRLLRQRGYALLIDYGEDFTQQDSLRAFKLHQQIHLLSQPGSADLTADVDFAQCRKIAERCNVCVHPLETQANFLLRMGIIERVQQLIDKEETTEQQANDLFQSLKMLVDPQKMGTKYKVMNLSHTPPPDTVTST